MKSRSRTQSKSNLDISGINLSDMEGFENTSAFTCGDDMEVLLADASQDLNFSEFAIPMRVVAGGALDGKTIRGVDLVNTPGLFLTAMQEGGAKGVTKTVDPETILRGEDVLWFAGDMSGMQTLRRIRAWCRKTIKSRNCPSVKPIDDSYKLLCHSTLSWKDNRSEMRIFEQDTTRLLSPCRGLAVEFKRALVTSFCKREMFCC